MLENYYEGTLITSHASIKKRTLSKQWYIMAKMAKKAYMRHEVRSVNMLNATNFQLQVAQLSLLINI